MKTNKKGLLCIVPLSTTCEQKVVADEKSTPNVIPFISDDLSENNNLALSMPAKVRELDQQLADQLEAVGAKLPRRNSN